MTEEMMLEIYSLCATGQYVLISAGIVLNLYAIKMVMRAVEVLYNA